MNFLKLFSILSSFLFSQLALLCSFFFCLVFSNVVMFSPQDMYKYRAPVCIIRFQPVFFFFFFLRVCVWGVRLSLRAKHYPSLKFDKLPLLRRSDVFAACVTKKYRLFSCDNTRYRSVWRCDLCVSVLLHFFLFCLNFAPNICFVLILWWHFTVVVR